MAGSDFNFFRVIEEVSKIAEEFAKSAPEDHSRGSDSRQSDRPRRSSSRDRREGPEMPSLAQMAGLAAIGAAAFATNRGQKRNKKDPRKEEQKRTKAKLAGQQRTMREGLKQELRSLSNNRIYAIRRWEREVRAKEVAITDRAAFLAANPDKEELLDPQRFEDFKSRIRTDLARSREEAVNRGEQLVSHYIDAWRGFTTTDTEFEEFLRKILANKIEGDDWHQNKFLQRIDKIEGAIDKIREAIKRGAQRRAAGMADTRFLYVPAGVLLAADEIEILAARALRPRDPALAALFSELAADRISLANAKDQIETLEWNGVALADVLERTVLASDIAARLRADQSAPVKNIKRVGEVCIRGLTSLPAKELPLNGEDAVRILAALTADFESETNGKVLNLKSWKALEPATAQLRDKLRAYLTPEEAQNLLERLEVSAMRALDRTPRYPRKRLVLFAPIAVWMRDLAEIAGVRRSIQALELWEERLKERREARGDLLSRASPFWRGELAAILDAPSSDEHSLDETTALGYSLLQNFNDLDQATLATIQEELEPILNHGWLRKASRHNHWLSLGAPKANTTTAEWTLTALRSLLEMTSSDRAAYFGPKPPLDSTGTFAPLMKSQEKLSPFNAVIEKEAGDLLSAGKFAKAEFKLRQWLHDAPWHPLRSAVLAVDLESFSLSGWDDFRNLTNNPKVDALQVNLSDHCFDHLWDDRDKSTSFALEAGGISAKDLDFPSRSKDELRDLGRKYPTPWQGYMIPDLDMTLTGLAPVIRAIHQVDQLRRPDRTSDDKLAENAIRMLAEWWCFTAFCLTVKRKRRDAPLPRKVPLILGSHDFGRGIPDLVI